MKSTKRRYNRDDIITMVYQALCYLSLALFVLFSIFGIWMNSGEWGMTAFVMLFPFVIFGLVAVIRS